MASLSGEFQTDLGPPDVLTICVEALDSSGWGIDSVTERHIVSTVNGSGRGQGANVTIDLRDADGGTDIRISGSDSEDAPPRIQSEGNPFEGRSRRPPKLCRRHRPGPQRPDRRLPNRPAGGSETGA